jgi:hypothetical protein
MAELTVTEKRGARANIPSLSRFDFGIAAVLTGWSFGYPLVVMLRWLVCWVLGTRDKEGGIYLGQGI